MTLTVHSNECPKLKDGRVRHVFVKIDGQFECRGCGEPSNPAERWQSKPEQRAG